VTVNAPFVPPKPAPTPTHPAIEIVKDPKSQTIGEGDKATFKITVTNSGDVTLTDVQVTDPLSPQCNRNLGTLDVGQSKSYSCTRDNVKADFENVATASFTFVRCMTADQIVGWLATYSGLITASGRERAAALAHAREELLPRADSDGLIEIPMRSHCWRADRTHRANP